jgi:hypothetical protein
MSHTYEHRQYMIFNCSELITIDFNQVLETSADTVKKSVDQSKTFVKWDGDTIPPCVQSLTTSEGPYNYDEILNILATPAWTDSNQLTSQIKT